jgi:hypothetical protein
MQGFAAQTLKNGTRHVAIHYSADEEKGPAWVAMMKSRLATEGFGERDWQREMELREDIYTGEPVFADYVDSIHCPKALHADSIPILKNCQYIGGWDCGQTMQPAFVLVQVTPGGQLHAMMEVLPPTPEAMESFAPRVNQAILKWLPAYWDMIEHVADATVINRSGTDGRSAQQEAARHGFRLQPASNAWQKRASAVTWALADRIDEQTPRLLISGLDCPVLRAGFQGAYKWEQSSTSDQVGPGRVIKQPLKNGFSHVQDAFQYAALKARMILESKPFEVGGLGRR